ncbi:MAG: hypothetical protein K1X89_26235 [Myxococcaceae bacterium]|nr:hypothetical protein [Myxococcaceae bacterium]
MAMALLLRRGMNLPRFVCRVLSLCSAFVVVGCGPAEVDAPKDNRAKFIADIEEQSYMASLEVEGNTLPRIGALLGRISAVEGGARVGLHGTLHLRSGDVLEVTSPLPTDQLVLWMEDGTSVTWSDLILEGNLSARGFPFCVGCRMSGFQVSGNDSFTFVATEHAFLIKGQVGSREYAYSMKLQKEPGFVQEDFSVSVHEPRFDLESTVSSISMDCGDHCTGQLSAAAIQVRETSIDQSGIRWHASSRTGWHRLVTERDRRIDWSGTIDRNGERAGRFVAPIENQNGIAATFAETVVVGEDKYVVARVAGRADSEVLAE